MSFFKTMWKANSKHKKLPEELALQNSKEIESELSDVVEVDNEVVTFKLKYLGNTVVEKISGENISTEAVKNILKTAKAAKGRNKLQSVTVTISLKGIAVTDQQGNDILKISIYRISNCSTDPTHRQIFSFISTDADETMECHAFLCSKRKIAETVTLAVAHAFSTAFEAWKVLPTGREFQQSGFKTKENEKNDIDQIEKEECEKHEEIQKTSVVEVKLIDFDNDPCIEDDAFYFEPAPCEQSNITARWVCFEDDFFSGTPSKSSQKTDPLLA